MAKMLMGQITHARDRIKTITTEKLGAKPELPKQVTRDEIMKQIRNGDIVVKPTQLKAALDNYINRTPIEKIGSAGGAYDYQTRSHAPKTYFLTETVRSSLEGCLADVVSPITFAKNLEVWKSQNTAWEARQAAINAQAVVVEDAIVLGDQQAALIALQAFAAFQP